MFCTAQGLPSLPMDGARLTSTSSSVSTARRWTYDVFLSFRGEDTRSNFVDHLYAALDRVGIYTLKDDTKLSRGKSISQELVKAIEESMVAVVVFSKNYANSSWCLEELAKIIECQSLIGQRVLPVFYDVDPSDVRKQKGSFQAAFQQHQVEFIDDVEKVKRWREALATAATISGWDLLRTSCGYEAECIKQIVRNIFSYTQYHPTDNLVGIESRVWHVKSLLRKRVGEVYMIGIWGMGGVGKTTIARAVYHQISCEFEGSSFVEDVGEYGSDRRGLKSLQEKLLSEILMEESFIVKDCEDGICHIRRRLGRKKVLVVLDGVDDIKQLEYLAGHQWFGPGSRIIVTTRDKHMLCYAQEKYAPELLNESEAMKLFSRYAFKTNIPPKEYEKLSGIVVSRTGRLPLALKVLGSHFCCRTLDFWQSGLNVLAKIPQKEINGILKLSFDGLNILEKKIFLEIACFYKGREISHVTRILDSFGFEPKSGITVLIERSLLTNSNGCLHMHDLIQEMGRFVVRECYQNNILWVLEEIKEVMTTVTRSKSVEAIVDTTNYHYSDMPMAGCSAEVFKSMKKLRLLEVKGKFTASEPKHFPGMLRWLCWYMYPFPSVRIRGDMTKLVGLEMQSSQIEQLHIDKKVILPNLKFMDLSFSLSIKSFPDVSGVPNLEHLDLSFCSDLVEVHQSVLLHKRIIDLYLSSCDRLKSLPPFIQMKSLQTLHLNACSRLKRFPEVSGEMRRMMVLNIDGCDRILALPPSITLLTGLIILTMGKYDALRFKPSRHNLRIIGPLLISSLRALDLIQNHLVDEDIPGHVHHAWPFLEKLDLSKNHFKRLSFSRFLHLKHLNLSYCNELVELPELPSLIQVLRADRCESLRKIGDLSNRYKWLFKISFCGCFKLLDYEEISGQLANLWMKSLVQKCAAVSHRLSISVPGRTIPNWFTDRQLGDKITLNLPQDQITKITGLAICCLFSSKRYKYGSHHLKVNFKIQDEMIDRPAYAVAVWMGYMPTASLQNLGHFSFYNKHLISFVCDDHIMECGVCVVYEDDMKPVTVIESWIPDHMEFGWIDHQGLRKEDLQLQRWSKSSFLSSHGKTGDNTELIYL